MSMGLLTAYRVLTRRGCIRRLHETTLRIERKDDPDDRIDIGPVDITDCLEHQDNVVFKASGSERR